MSNKYDKWFVPSNMKQHKSAVVKPVFMEIMLLEAIKKMSLSNGTVAKMIIEQVPNAKTTHKSVASMRSKMQAEIKAMIKKANLK